MDLKEYKKSTGDETTVNQMWERHANVFLSDEVNKLQSPLSQIEYYIVPSSRLYEWKCIVVYGFIFHPGLVTICRCDYSYGAWYSSSNKGRYTSEQIKGMDLLLF